MVRTPVGFVRGTVLAFALSFAPVYSVAAKAPASTKAAAAKVAAKKAAAKKAAAAKAEARLAAMSIEERVDNLKPGQWVWQPDRASGGPVELFVSLGLQKAYVYRGGTLIGATTISSGREGHDTPVGRFPILQKRVKHFSNKYDNAPMPYMQRLTWSGVALHGGHIPGYPASHGCIRLPTKFAAKLFEVTDVGATVLVADETPSPEAAYAMLQGRNVQSAMGGPEEEIEPSSAFEEIGRTVEALASTGE
jgi:lipoprotein-anchoring transpeptidase ErfK/SrfK